MTEPRPYHERFTPQCECGATVVLLTTNRSVTEISQGSSEKMIVEKRNYQCHSCHATLTLTRMSGDDPKQWLGDDEC